MLWCNVLYIYREREVVLLTPHNLLCVQECEIYWVPTKSSRANTIATQTRSRCNALSPFWIHCACRYCVLPCKNNRNKCDFVPLKILQENRRERISNALCAADIILSPLTIKCNTLQPANISSSIHLYITIRCTCD